MRGLPRYVQLPLTYLTGKPLYGQTGPRMTPTAHLGAAVFTLCSGLTMSAIAVTATGSWAWWLLLIPGWASVLHGQRNLRLMIFHQCAHRNMWGKPRWDRVVGRLVAGLLLIQSFERYQAEHVADHHARHHMTVRDPTVQAILLTLELRPGMTRRRMWATVLGKVASPLFHARFFVARLRSYFHSASVLDRILTPAFHIGVIAVGVLTETWLVVVLGWWLPLVLFFQISNTFRLCVKHTFPDPSIVDRKGRAYFGGLTNAIFLGEAAPSADLPVPRRALRWLRWGLRMAFVHFPSRYLVLTGDTVCHDFHHRYPMARNWADYIFARQRDLEAGQHGWPDYVEVWGLKSAIDFVFDSLRAADPVEYDAQRIAQVSQREMFAAFDD